MRLSLKPNFTPAQATMLSFVALALAGAFLLILPISNTNGHWRDFTSAFFMSISAVCVTGLSVIDVGKDFTLFGQLVTLVLIQVGGLSYMTITTIFIYMVGKKLSFSDNKIFELSNNSDQRIDFRDFVLKIGVLTVVFEGLGFLFLFFESFVKYIKSTDLDSHSFGAISQIAFQSLFHAVSAFCNCGLSLYSDSLCGFRDNYWVLSVICVLTISGGLGYTVLSELITWFNIQRRNLKELKKQKYLIAKPIKFSLSLHTRICLAFTSVLLIIGILSLLMFIHTQDLGSLNQTSFIDKLWISIFQSVVSRSSGFNSIPLNELGEPSLVFLLVWMFIGACPGGTAGGIKVTTLAVILAMIRSGLKNDKDVKLFNRSIIGSDQRKSMIVFATKVIATLIALFVMSMFEADKNLKIFDQLFEITSAFGTVGLSTGITAQLSNVSLIVLCLCMLIGRPGPLLFLMAIISEDKVKPGKYPEEGVLIG